jgi:hypothetical protein
MKSRRILVMVLATALLFSLAGGLSQAQGPGGEPTLPGTDAQQSEEAAGRAAQPDATLELAGDLGAGFYYQGTLTQAGVPVSGVRQMEFKLFDAASGGAQVGGTLTQNVTVTKGQFSTLLNWGSAQIYGKALWLAVRAKDSGGVLRDMGRRQILAVPYAMSLIPGAEVIGTNTGDVFHLRSAANGYPLRVITTAPGYDGIWGTGTNQGVYGDTTGTGSGDSGVFGGAFSSTGSAKGGHFESNKGIGVYGESYAVEGVYGNARSTTNEASGVYGKTASSTGISAGVYGLSASDGLSFGMYARTDSPSGRALWGYASSGTGTPYAIAGGAWDNGYAGYFVGRVNVSGNLTKGGGAFKIDHPLDPENQYLYHSFVESPDMKNVYDGMATLDGNGRAWVTLPDWFEALNRDFRYQLTPVGAPGPNLHVAQEIRDNRFEIAGGTPGMKVSWQVTGIRHDPYADANRIPVEEAKPASERGTYLYPQAYGQPDSKGVNYEMLQTMQQDALRDAETDSNGK